MTKSSSGPDLAQDANTSSQAELLASGDWGGLRQAGLLRSAGQEPLILAFVSSLGGGGDEADVERIRAEVRGLGVTLLLISNDTVWCFGADDSLQKVRAPADVDAAVLRDLFERFRLMMGADGVSDGASDPSSLSGLRAVFVVDSTFALRFAHVAPARAADSAGPPRSTFEVLLRALVAASVGFERRRTPGVRLSFSELTTLAVVSGMQRVLLGQRDMDDAVRAPQAPSRSAPQTSFIAAPQPISTALSWPSRVIAGRRAPEPSRHAHSVRTADGPLPPVLGASS